MFDSTARFKALAVTRVYGREGRHNPHLYFPSHNFITYWRFWTSKNRIFEHFRMPVFRRPRLLSQTADNKSQTNMARSSGSAQGEFWSFSGGCSKVTLSSVPHATKLLFTYQNVGDKRNEISLESETLPFVLFSLPENEAIFLLLWSLWRHINSAKTVNHLQFASCDWIIQQKAHYKPWVTENSPANKQKIRNMTASHVRGKSREFDYSPFRRRRLKFIDWFNDSRDF